MDPQATLEKMIIALSEKDLVTAAEYAGFYQNWVARGGFTVALAPELVAELCVAIVVCARDVPDNDYDDSEE